VSDVLPVIRQAVATVLEVPAESVDPGQHFANDLQADSLALVSIVEIVEEELARTHLGFVIDDPDLDGFLTVQLLVDYCQARLR
jgi:acyl carrier protein